MKYSHIKLPGLLLVMLLTGMVSYLNNSQPASSHTVSVSYAKHGLRVYVDPDTGQYVRPPEQSADMTEPALTAQAMIAGPATVVLSEQASAKSNGGYSIDLRERYRSNRHGPHQGS